MWDGAYLSYEVTILATGAIHWQATDEFVYDGGGSVAVITDLPECIRREIHNFVKSLVHS